MKSYIPIFLLAGTVLSLPIQSSASKLRTELMNSVDFQQTILGRVVDGSGNPIESATVAIQGTNRATATDKNGQFTLESSKSNVTLVVSFVGFTTKTQQVSGDLNNVVIQLDNKNDLEEIVVVGYGTQKKINLTGAVSQVTSEVLENRPAASLSRMLQGALPNLNLKMVDGSPTRGATFNVRGSTSIGAGGSALVLIDGVEGDPNMINPNDIESVTVLKDASSAAIYGSRAAFGVVLITTKNPKAGKATVTLNSNFSMNNRVVEAKLVTNGYEWAKNFNEAFNASYDYKSTPISVNNIYPFSLEYLEALKQHSENPGSEEVVFNKATNRYEYFGNTDWYNMVYRENMPSTEQAMSVSGGGEKASYFLSGRYFHQGGLFNFNPDKFNKYNIRGKGDVKVT